MKDGYKHRDTCRICGSKNLTLILDLGVMPLANAFLSAEEIKKPEAKFPLVIYYCQDCTLVSLLDVVEPNLLFKNYHYLTGASAPLVAHFQNFGEKIIKQFITSPDDLVVEIGSNDGVLLQKIKSSAKVLGIDPAENVAALAEKRGVRTLCKFFSKKLAEKIVKNDGRAKVIVANNVMAHIDDVRDAFSGVRQLLRDDGVFIFEVHWVGNLIGEGGFDQIYHEHLSYYSLHALSRLLELTGLKLLDIETVPIHGESLRVYAGCHGEPAPRVQNFIERERQLGLNKPETYLAFSKKVEKNRAELISLLTQLKQDGKKIAGYGAPAKGNTLLNYFGIDGKILDYITDTTLFKQGLYTPGTHIQIYPPEKIPENPPDYALLLSWNYAESILQKEKPLRDLGVKFIIPVPKVRVV